jgi:hypothetical protein
MWTKPNRIRSSSSKADPTCCSPITRTETRQALTDGLAANHASATASAPFNEKTRGGSLPCSSFFLLVVSSVNLVNHTYHDEMELYSHAGAAVGRHGDRGLCIAFLSPEDHAFALPGAASLPSRLDASTTSLPAHVTTSAKLWMVVTDDD